MNDLISRKAAIDALGERPTVWIDDDEYSLGQRNQYDCDKLAIETVPSAQSDLIAKIQDGINATNANDSYSCGMRNGMRWCMSLIDNKEPLFENCPFAQPEQRWIPVTERLPKDGERVLATHLGNLNPNRQVIEHIYQYGKFAYGWDMDMNVYSPTFGQQYMGDVVAWMPFPEPYQEGEQWVNIAESLLDGKDGADPIKPYQKEGEQG